MNTTTRGNESEKDEATGGAGRHASVNLGYITKAHTSVDCRWAAAFPLYAVPPSAPSHASESHQEMLYLRVLPLPKETVVVIGHGLTKLCNNPHGT